MPGTVHVHIDGALARVTLASAGQFNAMSRAMWRELAGIFRRLQSGAAELAAVRAKGLKPQGDCAGEAAALLHRQQIQLTPLRLLHRSQRGVPSPCVYFGDLPAPSAFGLAFLLPSRDSLPSIRRWMFSLWRQASSMAITMMEPAIVPSAYHTTPSTSR